jgi:hypothetical protein
VAIDACLVDTNVLLRIPRLSDPNHPAVDKALAQLAMQGTTLHYTRHSLRIEISLPTFASPGWFVKNPG